MTPQFAIAMLDRMLRNGENVTLSRPVEGSASIDVTCRARPDTQDNDKVSAALRGSDVHLIISPTQIIKAGWPDGNPANILPVAYRDTVTLAGDPPRTIAFVDPQTINGVVVRINLRITA